jgi:cytochrome c oxidase subunit II
MGPGEETGGIRERRQSDRAQIGPLIALSVIASAIGIAIGLAIDWFPTAASTQAGPIDTLWDVLVIVSVPVFVGVVAAVLYSAWRFRMRPGQELEDGAPIHGNTRLEVIWTVIPALVILGLCVYAYAVLEDIEDAPAAQEMRVGVIGQQFTWTFQYPAGEEGEERKLDRCPGKPKAGGERPVTSNQLYLPVNRSVQFKICSRDVLHSFWVPDFRMKLDTVPGIATDYRVTPNKLGKYEIVCAELCGIGHAYMRQTVHVVPQEAFDAWLEKQRSRGGAVGGGANPAEGEGQGAGAGAAAATGRTVFTDGNGTSTACGGCHKLADARTAGGVGPALDEALAGKDAAFIKDAIVNPDKEVEEGFQAGIMPKNYGEVLSPEELDALVTYLDETVK